MKSCLLISMVKIFASGLLLVSIFSSRAAFAASTFSTDLTRVQSMARRDNADIVSKEHFTTITHHGRKTKRVILIIHGLHGSPQQMSAIADGFTQRGDNVISINLPGHFRKDPTSLTRVSFREWIDQSERFLAAARRLGDKVTVLGLSTGATLAMRLGLKYPDAVSSVVLIGPALALSNSVVLTSFPLAWSSLNTKTFCDSFNDPSNICRLLFWSDEQLREMLSIGQVSSPSAGYQVQLLIDSINDEFSPRSADPDSTVQENYFDRLFNSYSQLKPQALFVTSDIDNVVSSDVARKVARQLGSVSIELPESAGVKHIYLTVPRNRAYKSDPDHAFNSQFTPMLKQILEFTRK